MQSISLTLVRHQQVHTLQRNLLRTEKKPVTSFATDIYILLSDSLLLFQSEKIIWFSLQRFFNENSECDTLTECDFCDAKISLVNPRESSGGQSSHC